VLDVTQRHIADMRHEIESIVQRSDITLPGYISVSIPILGTPFFQACMKKDLILPRTKVRDLDGSTLSVRTLDPLPAVVEFMRGAQHLEDYRGRVLRQLAGFVRRYRFALDLPQLALAASNAAILCAPLVTTAPAQLGRRRRDRTFVSTTDVLDDVYTPTSAVAERYARYFEPTMITDEAGKLVEALADDLRESRGALTATAGRITNGATATTRSRAA
jgi:hypothetical protein